MQESTNTAETISTLIKSNQFQTQLSQHHSNPGQLPGSGTFWIFQNHMPSTGYLPLSHLESELDQSESYLPTLFKILGSIQIHQWRPEPTWKSQHQKVWIFLIKLSKGSILVFLLGQVIAGLQTHRCAGHVTTTVCCFMHTL